MNITAPWPEQVRFIELPSADFGNSKRPLTTVNFQRALDGTRYSYVNDTTLHLYTFNLRVTRMKALELLEVYKLFSDKKWKIINDNATEIIGFIRNNPFTLTMKNRGTYCPDDVVGSRENVDLVINFEGSES